MNWTPYLKTAVEAARRAGVMLKDNIDTGREISFKGAVDIVTNFDSQAQEMIHDKLSDHYPDHDFLAEEGLSMRSGSDFCWIFDPIDGTTNFAHGFPVFCVSIALEFRGAITVGVVYDPMREELFSAVQGGGAFLNEKRIEVSTINELDKSLLSTGFPYDIRDSRENNLDNFENFVKRAQAIRRCGSAAIDLCYVACSRFDGFWELKLNPWDVAAAALILEEAGGKMSDFKGNGFDIYGKQTMGSNSLIHDQMIEVLNLPLESLDP